MPEFRQDPITGRWVIIAPQRAARPNAFVDRAALACDHSDCPFCEGREAQTPPETLARRVTDSAADTPGWRVRAVPNKFPALTAVDSAPASANTLFRSKSGCGVHEVIVESPRHVLSLTELSLPEVAEAILAYAERLTALGRDQRLKYGLLFKNVGAAAGASLEHTHAQLLATPFVPAAVQQGLDGAAEFHRRHSRCPFCAMLESERQWTLRMVAETPQFAAFCPYASRFGYETWILPRKHAGRFEDIGADTAAALAEVFRHVLAAIERLVDPPAYNLVVHTLPFGSPEVPHYHWHIEILPSLTKPAGFEWGTGIHINAVSPEEAAERMTNVEC